MTYETQLAAVTNKICCFRQSVASEENAAREVEELVFTKEEELRWYKTELGVRRDSVKKLLREVDRLEWEKRFLEYKISRERDDGQGKTEESHWDRDIYRYPEIGSGAPKESSSQD